MSDSKLRAFTQSVIDNIKKHGFPGKKVAFPIEQLYEAAHNKGINFNKVLATLDEIQIAHTKTPEKVIFYPKDRLKPLPSDEKPVNPLGGIDLEILTHLSPEMTENLDLSSLMGTVASLVENMSPEKLQAVKDTYENMSDEERAAMLEQVLKMGSKPST
jgi:hypothetical protein